MDVQLVGAVPLQLLVEDVVIAYPVNDLLSFKVAVMVLLLTAAFAAILVIVGLVVSVVIVWVSDLAVLPLPALSLQAPAATFIVLLPSEAWVTTSVYLLSLTLVKVPFVPSLTVTLLAEILLPLHWR